MTASSTYDGRSRLHWLELAAGIGMMASSGLAVQHFFAATCPTSPFEGPPRRVLGTLPIEQLRAVVRARVDEHEREGAGFLQGRVHGPAQPITPIAADDTEPSGGAG